jgi:Tol biopolymer transport system component
MRASHRNAAWAALALAGALAGCEGNTNNDDVAYFAVTRRASLNSNEKEANEVCSSPSISADGRYVAFASKAVNLHPDDNDLGSDIFVRDLRTGQTILASRATDGATPGVKANNDCFNPKISADGRFVVFDSLADNLHPEDTDVIRDIFMRDLQTGTTLLVSKDLPLRPDPITGDKQRSITPAISGDGQFVAFRYGSGTEGGAGTEPDQIWVRDMVALTSEMVSIPPAAIVTPFQWNCYEPAISADGRFVAFAGNTTLSPLNPYQVYVRDLQFDSTVSASVSWTGGDGNGTSRRPSLSEDGQYVAFQSAATDLISAGLDANGETDIYVRDLIADETVRVSNANAGTEAIGASSSPAISATGRYVAFVSTAANLVNGDTNGAADIFVRDTVGRTTVRASVRTYGSEANDASDEPAITADGAYVAFSSVATDLVEGDNNNTADIFVRGPLH